MQVIANPHDDFLKLSEDPRQRRFWFLYKALECGPLDRALDLARSCDDFVTGAISEHLSPVALNSSHPSAALPSQQIEEPASASTDGAAGLDEPTASKPTRLTLSTEQREQLLERLAQGSKNAELAAAFGLSSRQVQGIRMGCAREIADRRTTFDSKRSPDRQPALATSVDEVVRYLRQQDDVVVPQEGGEFLVNARFRLQLAELVSRANRMRARQGKPEFEVSTPPAQQQNVSSANGHPLFWSKTPSVTPTAGPMASL